MQPRPSISAGRILYDVPCEVCSDNSSGKHYSVYACDGCAGFFKRSIRRDRRYVCKAHVPGRCLIDRVHRNQCRACRLAKCLDVGMNRDAVQHERGPRNSTIRRQMAEQLRNAPIPSHATSAPVPNVINLAELEDSFTPSPRMLLNPYAYNRNNLYNMPLTPQPGPFRAPMGVFWPPADPEFMNEEAARILCLNVRWIKNIPAFASLSLSDRILLLEETWRDLFIIASAQFLYRMDFNILCNRNNSTVTRTAVDNFTRLIFDLVHLNPDKNEYACLRGVALFKTSFDENNSSVGPSMTAPELKKLQDLPAVAALQSYSQQVLTEYTTRNHIFGYFRSSSLLQILSVIRTIPSETIVDLFFRDALRDKTVEKIIRDMYQGGIDDDIIFRFPR